MAKKSFTPLTHDECFKLIGAFMYHWAMVEGALNNALTAALKLETLSGVIVASNVNFRDKAYIAQTAIAISTLTHERRTKYISVIEKVSNLSQKRRNIVAHNRFFPSKKQRGIEFSLYKAKGKLEIKNPIWTEKEFAALNDEMIDLCCSIGELEDAIKSHRNPKGLMAALSQPKTGLAALGVPVFLDPQPQGTLGSGRLEAILETDNEMPPSGWE